MNDKDNMKLIQQALKDYEDGEIIEAMDALITVVERIDAFIVAEELAN